MSNSDLPIGVFDSGLGGLTVVREILKRLPNEHVIYFGDLARLPYGIKSKRQIVDFSKENTELLLNQGVKALVIACNSSASAAAGILKKNYNLPILDVIRPAAREAIEVSSSKRIGVIGTRATISSGAYDKTLKSLDSHVFVSGMACPLFVPLVEEGILNGEVAKSVIKQYVKPLLQKKIDTLILGCTHYPLLKKSIQEFAGSKIRLVDSAAPTVSDLELLLELKSIKRKSKTKGKLRILVSDLPQSFVNVGSQFLGQKLRDVKLVRLTEVAMIKRKWAV